MFDDHENVNLITTKNIEQINRHKKHTTTTSIEK